MKTSPPSKYPILSVLAAFAIVCASVLTLAFMQQTTGSISLAASGPQKGLSREAALKQLHAQLKARAPFSAEEKQVLFRFNNGEEISEIEADTVISRVLYQRYVEGKDLSPEQKALLKQYKNFIAQDGRRIADLEENDAGAATSSGIVPSGGTPNICSSSSYVITQSTGAIVPGTVDIGNHCDDCTTLIALPFPFMLYDQTFTQARVSSNGNLQFLGGNPAFVSTCLPASGFNYTIFAYWSDLFTQDGASGQGVFTSISGVAPNRIFNIEWRAKFCCSNGPPDNNFEIRLFENSQRFALVYGQTSNPFSERITIGVQRAGEFPDACFTQFSCTQPNPVFPGLVLNFSAGFDTCIQDDFNGNTLSFNSTTGAYQFQDCRKGFVLSGVGVVTQRFQNDFCKVSLSDSGPDPKHPDRNVQALVNTCTHGGSASVTLPGRPTFTIGDSNTTNSSCTCQ